MVTLAYRDRAPGDVHRTSIAQRMLLLIGTDVSRCPRCGHRPLMRQELAPQRPARVPRPAVFDSS
jgi:DNA-directed RNA polymerase subunit RPC12/RpoP